MTDDIFVYFIDIPGNVNEMVTPCFGGYTVYIDCKLDREHRIKAYRHAIKHIKRGDFEKNKDLQDTFYRMIGR